MRVSQFEVRPYEESDHSAIAEIYRQTLPHGIEPPATEEANTHRYVAFKDGRRVGYGTAPMQPASGLTLLVAPDIQRQGAGTELWKRLEADLLRSVSKR